MSERVEAELEILIRQLLRLLAPLFDGRGLVVDHLRTGGGVVDPVPPSDDPVMSQEDFIVLEDLTKNTGEAGRFTLYRWQDIRSSFPIPTLAVESSSWSSVKDLYRH